MIKNLVKILSVTFFIVILSILYLSFIGIKTDKFNEKITNRILQINKKINLDLKDIKLLLNPYNFTLKITTKDPIILLENKKIKIKNITTNVSLKSLIFDEFLLEELKISTKPIILNDIISLVRSFRDSSELFLLDRSIEGGFLIADINLRFDKDGRVKEDYLINGFIKNGKFSFLNQINTNNLNLNFGMAKNKYSLTEVNAEINDVIISSSLIEISEKKDLFYIKGKILTSEKDFNIDQLSEKFLALLNNPKIEKARFSTENDISFNVSKKLKFNDLSVESKINLDQLIIKNNFIDLKSYLPDFEDIINFKNHKIIINYNKDKLDIKGSGKILNKNKFDSINYNVIKNNDKYTFDIKTNLKNSKLSIDFLEYEKKENLDVSILIKGNFEKNNLINFDLITLIENNNTISFTNLNLYKDFTIISMDSFNFNYLNNKKIKNQLDLKKNNSNYIIKGESFDATKLIDKIMDSDDENVSLFHNFNSKIDLKINKTYIDEVNFVDNLHGTFVYKNNKIDDLV